MVTASLASGADDVVVCPPVRRRPHRAYPRRAQDVAGAGLARALRALRRRHRPSRQLGRRHAETRRRSCPTSSAASARRSAGPRVALMLCTDETNSVLLVSASDDPSSMKVPIKLDRYPELRAAFESREPVLVEDARSSALLGPWAELAAEKGGRALLAVPLLVERKVAGALLLRNYVARPPLGPRAHRLSARRGVDARAGAEVRTRLRRPARADAPHGDVALQRRAAHARARAVQRLLRGVAPTAWWCSTPRRRSSTSIAPPSR